MSPCLCGMTFQKLIVFLKAPRVGEVKSRLAKTMGAQAAADAYRKLLEIVLRNIASLAEVELRFAPDNARAECDALRINPNWTLRAQGAGDLGERLHRAFVESFAEGTSRIVIIGSDCPYVQTSDIESAWESLHSHDVVLGPAEDGGYWLIGLRASEEKLFQEINWSSATVLCETLQRANTLGRSVHLLRRLSDIDTEADWNRFLESSGFQV